MNILDEKPQIKNALLRIASLLNENNVRWALGGSLLLYLKGIHTSVADIDVVIDPNDSGNVKEIVKQMNHIEKSKSDIYLTERFYSITLDDVDIDLMIGFKVSTMKGTYTFPNGDKFINESIILEGTTINLCSVKDWLQAYIAIGRTDKINLIKESKLV